MGTIKVSTGNPWAVPLGKESDEREHENVLIRLEQVGKVFGRGGIEISALSNIDLTIRSGEYVAISGPSGCGKSTLLSLLGLMDFPTTGNYFLKGKNVDKLRYSDLARMRNQEIGFIFQAFNLIDNHTVYENVALPLTFRLGMRTHEVRERVLQALSRVDMLDHLERYPVQLSGGQQQRVALARAWAGSPSILLADEPTGNLDSANGDQVMRIFEELHQEGATICMVTHEPRYAARATRVFHLFDGRLVPDRF